MRERAAMALIVLALCLGCAAQELEMPNSRIHQHREAAEKAACTTHGEETFCTHLPLMCVWTDGAIPSPYLDAEKTQRNDQTVAATVSYFDSESGNNHLTDTPTLTTRAAIRVRGTTSRDFDKKGYLLKCRAEDDVTARDVSFSGMTAAGDWVLHGPFLDKTLLRNYLCYNLAGEIMDYAPNVRFFELFLNGSYEGLYLLVEQIERGEDGRIRITKSDPACAQTSYILCADRGASDPRYALESFGMYAYFTAPSGAASGQMEICYPRRTLTQEQFEMIRSDFSRFEKALFSYDYKDADKGYRAYIDVDSFVDYFLINEFTLNYDAPQLSTYLYKDIGGRLKLCVWDFNSAFDCYTNSLTDPQSFHLPESMWYRYLCKDPAFVTAVVQRYWQLRRGVLDEEFLLSYIDETVAYLGAAVTRNFERWGYSFSSEYDLLDGWGRNARSYDAALRQLKRCISERIAYMDENIERLYALCHESVNKRYNYDEETKGIFG